MRISTPVITALWDAVTQWEDAGVRKPAEALPELIALISKAVKTLDLGELPIIPVDNVLMAAAFEEFWSDESLQKRIPSTGVLAFASLLTLCGQCATRVSDYHRALVYLRSAANLYSLYYRKQQTESVLGESTTRNELALLFAERGDLPQARKELDNARYLAERSNLPKLIARTLRTQGLLQLYQVDERDRALPFLLQSHEIAQKVGDRVGQALVANNLGGYYLEFDRFREAVEPLMESAAIARAYGYEHLLSSVLSNLALVYSQLKQPQLALETSHEAFNLRKAQGGPLGVLISILNLGTLIYEQPQLLPQETLVWPDLPAQLRERYASRPALAYMVHANREIEGIRSSRFHSVFAVELARYAKLAGDHELALEYLDLARRRQYVESKESTNNLRAFFELEMHLEKARHEAILYRVRNDELTRSKAALEALNHERTALMCTLAHDLRNAVSTIIGRGEILNDQCDELPPKHVEHIRQIMRSGRWVADFLNKILSLEAIESGHYPIVIVPVPVTGLLLDTVVRHSVAANHSGIRLQIAEGVRDGFVLGDEIALAQIFDNFVLNALKHSSAGGSVVLDAQVSPDYVVLSVIDSGDGVPAEQQCLLFQKFARIDSTRTANQQGKSFGLGLAICKALAEAMQGEVGCESKAGEGSTFWCKLPRSQS